MMTEIPPLEEDDRVEICYTEEQLTIRALVDAMDQRVLHIKAEE